MKKTLFYLSLGILLYNCQPKHDTPSVETIHENWQFKNVKDTITGNFRKLAVEERVCEICKCGDTEDEVHMLLTCEKYCTERNLFFEKIQSDGINILSFGNISKLEIMMTTKWRETMEYLFCIWNIRRSFVQK